MNKRRFLLPPKPVVLQPKKREKVLPLPRGFTRNELFQLWLRACRRHTESQLELHRLLNSNRQIQSTINHFIEERKKLHKGKAGNIAQSVPGRTPTTAWEQMAARGSGWVTKVSGGLPSLGRRR
jgi:hypothetical protein